MSFGPSVRNGLGIGLGPTATLATAFSQATLDFDFIDNQVFPTDITFTRASSATMFDSSGTLIFAPMNAIRNNTMVGAVAGTPGTLPTNWSTFTSLTGLTREIIGTGTENGITYIDIKLSGTPSAAGFFDIYSETSTGVAATTGQTWSQSFYIRVAAGTTTGVTSITPVLLENTSGGVFITSQGGISFTPATTALNINRRTQTATLTGGATVAAVRPLILLTLSGAAIDITLRIGMPQLQRGSTATAVNATSGTAYQAPRLDYDPSTLAARGLLIEEQRVNSIRNNTMQGAVAGTPGTLPTNWAIGGVTTGLTISVVGTGTESGITYIDIRFNGTAGAALNPNILFDTSTGIAAANGQTWAWSSYVSLVGGSLTNVTNIIAVQSMFSSTPTLLGTLSGSPFVPTGAALNTQRQTFVGTLNQATTAFVRPQLQFSVANGAAIDITLRIGLPQLEQGAFATSVIPTTTTATTRSADVASVNTLSPWFNQTAGTLYAEYSIPSALPAASNPTFASLVGTGGVGTNAIAAYINTPSGKNGSFNVWSSGSVVGRIDVSSNFVAGSVVKYAAAFAANDRAVTSGGFTPTTSSTAYTIPTVSSMTLGSDPTLAAINGYLRRITYYPSRLSNAQLQALTA